MQHTDVSNYLGFYLPIKIKLQEVTKINRKNLQKV